MAKRKKINLRRGPPCPDPALYVLVKTKEGAFWRRKRGTLKKAEVNHSLRRNNEAYKIVMPAAARLLRKLEPFTRSLRMGRITVKMAGRLLKPYKEKESVDITVLDGFDLQPEFPLEGLLLADYTIEEKGKTIMVSIDLDRGRVKPQNKLVTDYYFELVLLCGDASIEKGLKLHSAESGLYSFLAAQNGICELQVAAAPANMPWLLLLKVNCLEGREMAMHSKNYGLRVIRVGR